jgi:putative nucleotidyltransferase with HDIG domain
MRGVVARRMLALFILCALLPVGALALLSLLEMSGKLEEQTEQRLRHAAKNVGMEILDGLAFLSSELDTLGIRYAVGTREAGGGGISGTPGKVPSRGFLSLTRFGEGSRAETFFGAPCPFPPLTEAARRHLASGQALVFVRSDDGANSRVFMGLATDRTRPETGILVGEIRPDYLKTTIENALPVEGDTVVLSPEGSPLYGSGRMPPEVVGRIVEQSKKAVSGQFVWEWGTDTRLVSHRSIFLGMNYHSEDWIVIVSQPRSEAFAPVRTFARTFVLIVVLTVLAVSLVAIRRIRKSLVPLEKLREGTTRISNGDFDSRIEVASGDEFEELARSFNDMSGRLGRQFDAETGMGRFTRSILSALDRERIVETVLANIRSVVPCDWVGLALMEPEAADTARIHTYGAKGPATTDPTFAVLTPGESERLAISECLLIDSRTEFPGLLSTAPDRDVSTFLILPIFLRRHLCAVLVLGYRRLPERPREDMIRVRQIGDQVTVALLNAGLVEELSELNWGTLTALARAVDANSPWTAGHSERVTALALAIGREMGWNAQELDTLHRAGLLHDIGKIGVPGNILDKPGKLTAEEYVLVKEHPGKGAQILEPINAYKEILPMVGQHHEWYDGRGYPKGLAGDAICEGARILAVADVYDALISDRPYRPGLEPDRVIAHIRRYAGSQFDPGIVETCCRILSEDQPSTQEESDSSAFASPARPVPPAWAMSLRPPPPPPTNVAAFFTMSDAE